MIQVCRTCAGRLDLGPCVFCSECIVTIGKLARAVARVALRFDVAAPVELADLDTIRGALGEALAPFRLAPQVRHTLARGVEVVELEAWEVTPPRRRWQTTIIVRK